MLCLTCFIYILKGDSELRILQLVQKMQRVDAFLVCRTFEIDWTLRKF